MNKKIILLTILIILIGIIAIITFIPDKTNVETENEIEIVEEMDNKEEVNKENQDEIVDTPEILNVLIIGVDEGSFDNSRSDVMIIASIDFETKTVKLTSVMRDTLAYIPTSNTYQKLNHSYMEGGAKEIMLAINTNFDLNIEDYVVFDYDAVKKVVDFVGGYPVDVSAGEARDMGISTGHHVLQGDKAVDYMRVRYNSGGDTGRNQRQRDLIVYVMDQIKDISKTKVLMFATKLLPNIRTSYTLLDIEELLDLYGLIKNEITVEQYSFPFNYEGKILSDKLWYAVPKTMRTNVMDLHKNIYNSYDYVPSDVVNHISEIIENKSNVHLY